ncbi:hypothetical protein KVR01_009287 [Diaporthe batatas]|uniref:uncharacterized protein n=1 Tax=Diaporthe batatas TaxID=748121 RepID=UPI001D04DACF|nr:uncharacterized protein KVR01_009287 [Diaporthe batatas]KAG8161023.1 hypothetical protein KVR01_009287 [Diaporthe batatas]
MVGLTTTPATMSLRPADTDSIIQKDIEARDWSKMPAPPRLAPVEDAADEKTLFERRVSRPSNPFTKRPRQYTFRAPVFTPNSPLDEAATLAISPGRGHSTTGRANPGRSPFPPPSALLRCLPDFPHCLPHLCDHPSRAHYHHQATGEGAQCHMCAEGEGSSPTSSSSSRALHALPCGHLICGRHLTATADTAVSTALARRPPQVRENLEAASRELARVRRVGCGACGADMRLGEGGDGDGGSVLLRCLDEGLARRLWAVRWRLLGAEGGGVVGPAARYNI